VTAWPYVGDERGQRHPGGQPVRAQSQPHQAGETAATQTRTPRTCRVERWRADGRGCAPSGRPQRGRGGGGDGTASGIMTEILGSSGGSGCDGRAADRPPILYCDAVTTTPAAGVRVPAAVRSFLSSQ
jgi:hypothetical protein